jgi:hypothetical protein
VGVLDDRGRGRARDPGVARGCRVDETAGGQTDREDRDIREQVVAEVSVRGGIDLPVRQVAVDLAREAMSELTRGEGCRRGCDRRPARQVRLLPHEPRRPIGDRREDPRRREDEENAERHPVPRRPSLA